MQTALLSFAFSSSSILSAVEGALSPEAGAGDEDASGETPKTRARLAVVDGELRVSIEADDLSSLRAAVNSHLRWVDAATRAAILAQR